MTNELTQRKRGSKRVLAAAGTLVAVAVLTTAAAFTDFANLNFGNGSDDSGIGGNNRFNIQVVGTDGAGNPVSGTWQEANTEEGVNINIPGADTLAPGGSVTVEIPFRNESPALGAAIKFSLVERTPPSGAPMADEEYLAALRFSVVRGSEVMASGVPFSALETYDFGNYPALGDPGAENPAAEGLVTVTISLPNQATQDQNNALMGKVAYIQAHFDATSV